MKTCFTPGKTESCSWSYMHKAQKVRVSERALLARIQRKLNSNGQIIHKLRQPPEGVSRWFGDLGAYYTVVADGNSVGDTHINLELYAKELGVLKPYEEVAS